MRGNKPNLPELTEEKQRLGKEHYFCALLKARKKGTRGDLDAAQY
jgi:hypothetical protein